MIEAPEVSVVIPVHNEEVAIGEDLDAIRCAMERTGCRYEVIVVDDGSTDHTAEIVGARPWARLLQHPDNRGTGAATMTGIRQACGQIIVMTDGDGTYPNQDMPRLLSYMKEFDMVVGARKVEMGSWPWLRSPAKNFIRLLASYLTETRIPDLNSGLRAFRADFARKFFPILPSGHSWVSTITIAFLSSGYAVKYVPIEYYPRKGRGSHFHPIRDTYNYMLLVIRAITYFNPLKVFLPLSLLLFAAGAIKLVRDLIVFDWHVPGSTLMIILTAFQLLAIGLIADLVVRRGRT
ncbi:MAG TPA: glycosyltransferase family 2 protein [Dehalococcoidia bacterium]|nr:glycosyltransferase family 2 protein [Dehalococcoidia bacterium]